MERLKFPKKEYEPITDERLAQYLRVTHGIKLNDIKIASLALESHKFEESSLIQKIAGLLWYGFIEATGGITPKMIVKILTDLDKLLPFIPDPMAKKIIMLLDKIAEEVYKRL